MSTQEAFLSRIRRALQGTADAAHAVCENMDLPDAVPEPAEAIRARMRAQRAALVARVQEELRAVGGQVVRVTSVAEATQYVTQLAREYEADLVVRWENDLLEMLEVDAALQEQGVEVAPAAPPPDDAPSRDDALAAQRQNLRDLLARADIGLSGADYVIAETGTLALSTLPGQMRGVSLLPPVHVAVVKHSQIVATMADCLAMLQDEGRADLQARLTSCVSFITGPSRTGAIELSLTVGVHGPGELHLVILDDPSDPGSD